jgi:hypothetical protein
MKANGKLYVVACGVVLGIVGLWLSVSFGQAQHSYETETRVYATPEYRTDAGRAIDAYEKLMQRYMDATERNFGELSADIKAMTTRLDALNAALTTLDGRLARIEKHLGIVPPVADPNASQAAPRTLLPQWAPAASATTN